MQHILDIAAGVLGLYLFLVFLKQGFRRDGEGRGAWLALALIVLPFALAIHFMGRWDLTGGDWNDPANWWVTPIETAAKEIKNVNLIVVGFVIGLLSVGAAILVGFLGWYFELKRGAPMLSIHKVILKLAIVLLGIGVYLTSQGISLTPLWVGMGAASIVIGIALQEPLASLFTGVALDLEGVFRRGEWIRVGGEGGVTGRVVEKTWRTTKLVTTNDELVVIPNKALGSETILNYHQPNPLHAHKLYVGASYKDPPVKVKEVLRTILLREPRIAKDPPPVVRTIKYNDFSIDYELKIWINDYGAKESIKDAVMTQIWYAFKFNHIEIPFPIRTIHAKGAGHLAQEESALSEQLVNIDAFLKTLPYLSEHLTLTEFDFLADNCFQRSYRPHEHIIYRGELGDSVYIVRDKWCDVILPDGQERRIEAGHYFGEMGLLSQQPRGADVLAGAEGSTVIRIDRECMDMLFKRRPRLRDEFIRVRDMRLQESGAPAEKGEEVGPPFLARLLKALRDVLIPW